METKYKHKQINILERTNPIAILDEELENGDLKYTATLSNSHVFYFIVPREKAYLGKRRTKLLSQEWSKNLVQHLVSKQEYYNYGKEKE